ncbi:T9SS type A sorting domain-containing protein [Flavobacterium sp.]|uniref:T9SS type A sorting domain-containing protein n=1 Tax=Flavobacterium sp. TaxID=239 RepID=UPI0024895D11|nr:T9SS type A sorting domain-containing protein [Flavobacterium sp.]MDI1316419.1 T9SS type A sorting domain-containing protein [Flavobacterium sp.]
MKHYYLLLLVLATKLFANAQIINFPDANFKAKLLAASPMNTIASNGGLDFIKIDSNNDNEIDVNEALQIITLNVSIANISNIAGIEYFVNLRSLNCNQNQISTIEIGNLIRLKSLLCNLNLLTSLNLTGLTQLITLECAENTLTQINFANATNIQFLSCKFNFLTALEINNLLNLQTLQCDYNQLTTLNVSALTQLTTLNCPSNQFTVLDFSALVNLTALNCASNQLTALDVNNLNHLITLNFADNQITSIELTNLTNLSILNCESNQISNPFVLSNMAALNSLYCQENFIPSITFNETQNIEVLDCSANQISTLDASSMSSLSILNCHNNPLLTTLNIKNGSSEQFLNLSGNQNLSYICADVAQITTIENLIAEYGYSNCQVNSLCDLAAPDFAANILILVYPNPTKNLLHLQSNEVVTLKSIYLYNLLGQTVLTISNAKNLSTIDVSNLKTGSYFIKMVTEKGTTTEKFVKE